MNVLESPDPSILEALKRPELNITLTKLHCWKLTQYSKCVFMDADTLVVKNIDELFEKEELSAVSDIGWPDCFNSGVFVFVPSQQTFANLTSLAAKEGGSFDGGDQGLLNTYFSDWATRDINRHLSFIYNMQFASCSYSYAPAFKRFGDKVKVIHFLGSVKPWHYTGSEHANEFIKKWWSMYFSEVHPKIESLSDVGSLSSTIQSMSIQAAADESSVVDDRSASSANWQGQNVPFEVIQKKLDASIQKP